MRKLACIFLLGAWACTENQTTADYTGVRLNVVSRTPVALGSLEVEAYVGEESAFTTTPRVVPLGEDGAGVTDFERRQLLLVLEARFDQQALALSVSGKDLAGQVVAVGDTEVTLRLGFVPTATVVLGQGTTCGNGLLDTGEACDDHNLNPGDGCNPTCTIEAGFLCGGVPSVCGPEAETALVDAAATCPGNGTRGNPFCAIGRAFEVPWARLVLIGSGNYDEQVSIDGDRRAVAAPGAVLFNLNVPTLEIVGGQVELTGLTVKGGARDIGGGVLVRGAGTQATLRRVDLGPGSGLGLEAEGGAFVELTESRVRRHAGGGLAIREVLGYAVENVFLVENGNEQSEVGGAWLAQNPTNSRFAYVTVVANQARTSSTAGLRCGPGAQVEATISWDNGTLTATAAAACRFRSSDLGPLPANTPLGDGNFSEPPELDADYRLKANSPCIDRADGSRMVPATDYDGEPRPKGPGPDVGADER
ncbi:MAG: hypothetical protein IPG45_01330 [Deltaproteobacteria bacterium]|nr:hypothetical protein [Deltaproteobacteria bacterium]